MRCQNDQKLDLTSKECSLKYQFLVYIKIKLFCKAKLKARYAGSSEVLNLAVRKMCRCHDGIWFYLVLAI